jgi:hypothetical protein
MSKLKEKPPALKRKHPALQRQNMKFPNFFFVGHFAFLDPDPADQTQRGSMQIRIHKNIKNVEFSCFEVLDVLF